MLWPQQPFFGIFFCEMELLSLYHAICGSKVTLPFIVSWDTEPIYLFHDGVRTEAVTKLRYLPLEHIIDPLRFIGESLLRDYQLGSGDCSEKPCSPRWLSLSAARDNRFIFNLSRCFSVICIGRILKKPSDPIHS